MAEVIEETKVYTFEEIDIQLEFLSNLIRYAKHTDRVECFDNADKWLDRRLMLMGLEDSYAGLGEK